MKTPRDTMRAVAKLEGRHRELGKGMETLRSGYATPDQIGVMVTLARYLGQELEELQEEWGE